MIDEALKIIRHALGQKPTVTPWPPAADTEINRKFIWACSPERIREVLAHVEHLRMRVEELENSNVRLNRDQNW